MIRKVIRKTAALALCAAVLAGGFLYLRAAYLPDNIYVRENESFSYGQGLLTVRADGQALAAVSATAGDSRSAQLCLFDMIPVKTVRVTTVEETWLVPGGMSFGVKMFTAGVVIVGTADVHTKGGAVNPAKEAGLQPGDVILTVDGAGVSGNEDILAIVSSSNGRPLEIRYVREGETRTTRLTPANARNGTGFKAGMWVRDSSAGIGTVTYYNRQSGLVAGLGHGVTDTDTGLVLPVASGELVRVTISGVEKGRAGDPGELKGTFEREAPFARLIYNSESGVFARCTDEEFAAGQAVAAALRQEVGVGACKILCTVDGGSPAYYDAQIESVNLSDANPTRNMVVRITDEALIERTGGIVQGMSGSPILQNGKLVGALTHVFVNEPTKGYGIFIENMLYTERYALINEKNTDFT